MSRVWIYKFAGEKSSNILKNQLGETMKFYRLIKGIILSFALLPLALSAGDIVGNVKYDGKVPKAKRLRMDADPVCSASHQETAYSESFVVDTNGNLANVIVYLKDVAYNGAPPKEAAILDQNGCIYSPHVLAVMAGQKIKILNSDATMHNIHGLPKVNKEFNFGMPKTLKEKTITFDKPENVFVIKCDVHPWMKSYTQVFSHPYFAVTGADGSFKISDVPAGTYELIAWQEKFGAKRTLSQKVTVGDGKSSANFTFKRPKKKKK